MSFRPYEPNHCSFKMQEFIKQNWPSDVTVDKLEQCLLDLGGLKATDAKRSVYRFDHISLDISVVVLNGTTSAICWEVDGSEMAISFSPKLNAIVNEPRFGCYWIPDMGKLETEILSKLGVGQVVVPTQEEVLRIPLGRYAEISGLFKSPDCLLGFVSDGNPRQKGL